MDFSQGDRLLAVVPMFHANAWGLPYAALMSGSSLIMPDRFLQAEPLARMIADRAGHRRWRRADDLERPAALPGRAPGPTPPPALGRRRWRRLPAGADAGDAGAARHHGDPRLGHDRDVTARHDGASRRPGPRARSTGATARPRAGSPPACRPAWSGRTAPSSRGTASSVGELEVKGPWITGSYYDNGSSTEAERADAAAKFDDGWLRTGDVGSLTPDGYLTLTDRAKDVIKSGGEWISSVDLENALMAHPDVIEASVVGVPDDKWGERPLATVVRERGSTVDAVVLQEFLAGRIAHWQVPERWAFIDEVPKTSVGKFDKKVLRRRYAEGDLQVETLA